MTLLKSLYLIPDSTRFGLRIREKSLFKVCGSSLSVSLNFHDDAIVCYRIVELHIF